MEHVNTLLAFCVGLVLVPVLVGAFTLLLRKRIGATLAALVVCAFLLNVMYARLIQPNLVEWDRECQERTQQEYTACKAERNSGTDIFIRFIAVPTAIGVASSMAVLYVSDRRKRRTQPSLPVSGD